MGALIIEEVVKDLVTYHGMSSATKLYLAGSRYVYAECVFVCVCARARARV